MIKKGDPNSGLVPNPDKQYLNPNNFLMLNNESSFELITQDRS